MSEFRIKNLIERVAKQNYRKYLYEIKFERLRALENQKIRFDFPVTALIGTNGGGKSTVLGGAAMAYFSVRPRDHFPKSNVSDKSMSDWRLSYEIIDRGVNPSGFIQRSARFAAAKWKRDSVLKRDVISFPIMRTVPAGEIARYNKFVGTKDLKDIFVSPLPKDVLTHAGKILSRDISGYNIIRKSEDSEEYILAGLHKTKDYSQFHFGAGEASIIDMVYKIEAASDYALIVIEEIENGLHPLATRSMVSYLIEVAERKKAQVIFTTHSNYALEPLPHQAIWSCLDGRLMQGRLNIESLRAIVGTVEHSAVLFVEDDFAASWLSHMMKTVLKEEEGKVAIHPAGGYPLIIQVVDFHNNNPATNSKAIAVVDGDQGDQAPDSVVVLPGGVPELEVFGWIAQNTELSLGLIRQRCLLSHLSEEKILSHIKLVSATNADPHLIFREFADKCGYMSEITVRNGFISVYNEFNEAACRRVVDEALNKLGLSS